MVTEAAVAPTFGELCAQLAAVTAQLLQVDLATVTGGELAAGHQSLEVSRRRLDAVELHLVPAELEQQLPFEAGCASPAAYLAQLLTISPAQASQRVKNAAAFGPRRGLLGEPLEPIFTACAAAVVEGAVTCQAAASIVRELGKIPDEILAGHDGQFGLAVEEHLVGYARTANPADTARFAQDFRYRLDQDGQLHDEAWHQKARDLTRRRRPDGSGTYTVEATNELAELLDTVLDTYSVPKPAQDGTPDPRTPGQRRHDGLRDALRDLLQSENTPQHAGCRTTVILHASAGDFLRNEGCWTTGHGFAVPMDLGKTWLEPEARAILVLLTKTKGIDAYSSTERLFTEQQRLAMQARDRGCSFPACDKPAAWTQAHHVIEHRESGHTRVDEGALVCGEHHRMFEHLGWRNIMLHGVPAWIPPKWVDPDGTPKINTRHQPAATPSD